MNIQYLDEFYPETEQDEITTFNNIVFKDDILQM